MLENQESHNISDDVIMTKIEKLIDGFVTQHSSQSLTKVIQYHFQSGGKKIRAKMAYQIALEFKCSEHDALLWSGICEVLHNASLIHDDLQDQDIYRRNQLTVWKKYDPHTAITAGDFLIFLSIQMTQSLQAPDSIKVQLMELISRTSIQLTNGQFNESLLKLHSLEGLWDIYIQMIDQKTSALFELPLVGAGILSQCSQQMQDNLKQLAHDFGQLFQVQDDIIDLYGNKGRKNIGNDIKEGKLSALCAQHVMLHPQDHQKIIDILNLDRSQTTSKSILEIRELFKDKGSLSACLEFIQQKLNAIQNNKLLTTNDQLSDYFKIVIKRLMNHFDEVKYE